MRYYVLFPHEEERVRRTFDMIQEHYVQDGLVRSLLNPSGFPIKENCYYARLLALLGQESYACSTRLLSLNDSAHSFPDSIHALTKKGASIEGHSHNAAAYLLLQLMGLLVHDSGSELQLLPLVPDHWFFEGFYVDKLMTSQGPLSIKAELQDEHIYVSINFKAKPELKEFKLSLPSTVYAVKVGDRITEVQEPLINLSSSVTELMLFHK